MLNLDDKFVKETELKEAKARRNKITIKSEKMDEYLKRNSKTPIQAQDTVATQD